MEKVKLTKEQTRELVALRTGHGPGKLIKDFLECPDDYLKMFRNLSVAQFSLALNGWNEVEPSFKIGQWVKSTFGKGIGKIIHINNLGYHTDFGMLDDGDNIRHAAESEIAEEKERRFWERNGRAAREFKEEDIVKDKTGGYGFIYRCILRVEADYARCTGGVDIELDDLELVCKASDRKDVKE